MGGWGSVDLGGLGSRLRFGSGFLPRISQITATIRLPVLHFSHGDEKSQKGRGKPDGQAHPSLCLGHTY